MTMNYTIMVMKKVTLPVSQEPETRPPALSRRVGVAEAKAKLSGVLRTLAEGPVIIHSRGQDMGALLDIKAYERLAANEPGGARPGGLALVEAIEALKRRHGGGIEDFEAAPAVVVTQDPFRRRRA